MLTDTERNKRFRAERLNQLKIGTALQRQTYDDLIRLLELAEEQIAAILAAQPTDYQLWNLKLIQGNINRILIGLGERSQASIEAWAAKGIQHGVDLLDEPLRAAGVSLVGVAPLLDEPILLNLTRFMGTKLKDVSTAIGDVINTQLGLTVLGVKPVHEMVSQVQSMTDGYRTRARTIVNTEMNRAFNLANDLRLNQASMHLPGLKKRWLKSGKRHQRLTHAAAHLQTVDVGSPFTIGGIKMMHPHDPKAPAKEVINCGCTCVPHMTSWEVKGAATLLI